MILISGIQVEAMDPDAGKNGQVTYQIVRTEPISASSLFTIDKDTGYISTAAEIDRETYEKLVHVPRIHVKSRKIFQKIQSNEKSAVIILSGNI